MGLNVRDGASWRADFDELDCAGPGHCRGRDQCVDGKLGSFCNKKRYFQLTVFIILLMKISLTENSRSIDRHAGRFTGFRISALDPISF
jgi:hypothetical protein